MLTTAFNLLLSLFSLSQIQLVNYFMEWQGKSIQTNENYISAHVFINKSIKFNIFLIIEVFYIFNLY